jgi:beta-carotene 3-hydroxylase
MKARTLAAVTLAASEPAAALAHRAVMHGSGWRWHRSHHRPRRSGWEDNDRFPVVFAALTMAAMAVGRATGRERLVAAGAGVTGYGLLYLLVHDVGVHGRLSGGGPILPGRWLRWLGRAHAVHHRTGGAPYGFLVPIVPPRHRAAVASLRPIDTRALVENTS